MSRRAASIACVAAALAFTAHTAGAAAQSTSGEPRPQAPPHGPADARVTIVEYLDFDCEQCGPIAMMVESIVREHPDDVRVIFRNVPADASTAGLAYRAALAAGRQERFWEMQDLLFSNPNTLERRRLAEMASLLAIDVTQFQKDLDDPSWAAVVQLDVDEAAAAHVDKAPAVLVNAQRLTTVGSYKALKRAVESALGR